MSIQLQAGAAKGGKEAGKEGGGVGEAVVQEDD